MARNPGSSLWSRPHPVVRRAAPALLIAGLLLGLASWGKLQQSAELYILVAAVLAAFLAKDAYASFKERKLLHA